MRAWGLVWFGGEGYVLFLELAGGRGFEGFLVGGERMREVEGWEERKEE